MALSPPPANTNQYLSFDSHHPVSNEVAVVRTLMTRAEALPSSGVERAQEEKEVATALKENGYPSGFIHRHSCPPRPRPLADDMRPRTSVTLPYIGGLSEAIRQILRPLEIQVVFCPLTTLRQLLVHPKDPVPMELQSIHGQRATAWILPSQQYWTVTHTTPHDASWKAGTSRKVLTTSTGNEEHSRRSTRRF